MFVELGTNAITIAIEAIALLEALKVFLKEKTVNIPSWVFTILSFVFNFGLALIQCSVFNWVEIKGQIPIGLLAFSFSQLCYDSIWKTVQKTIKKIEDTGAESE